MDMNDYVIDTLVRQRLDDIRADARRAVLAATLGPPRQPLRVTLGVGLMRLAGGCGAALLGNGDSMHLYLSRSAFRLDRGTLRASPVHEVPVNVL